MFCIFFSPIRAKYTLTKPKDTIWKMYLIEIGYCFAFVDQASEIFFSFCRKSNKLYFKKKRPSLTMCV